MNDEKDKTIRVLDEGDVTCVTITRWDLFKGRIRHWFGCCDAMCSYCYQEACDLLEAGGEQEEEQ